MSETLQHAESRLSSTQTELRREVGLFGGVSVIAGIMIGSGIFYIGALVLERTGMSLGLSLLVWVIGGLVTLLSGICYAEMGAMMPKAGGVYVYLREAYGERLAFMCGFANFTLGNSGSIAALAVAFAAVIATFVPGMDTFWQRMLATGTVVILTAVNYRGIKSANWVQSFFMVLKMLPILVVLIAGLLWGTETPDLTLMPAGNPDWASLISMIGFGVIATLWAYEGWTNLNVISEEVKDPHRNIPLSMILSIVGVTVLYILFNYAVFRVLPYDTIVNMLTGENRNMYLGKESAFVLFGEPGLLIVGMAMAFAIFNSLSGCVMVFPRMYYAMSRDGAFFKSLAKLHPTYRTPVNALLASSGISIVLIWTHNLSDLTSLVAVCGMIFHGLAFWGVIRLRAKYPTMERPYKVWFYPYSVYLICAIMVGLIINAIINDPMTAALNFIFPIIGLVIYEFFFKNSFDREQAVVAAE